MSISTVINTKNAAQTLKNCLQSVQFTDELVLVDMHSTDETLKIAGQFTDKIYSHHDLGYADPARNFAISKASHDWILVIDADEIITPELRSKILEITQQDYQKAADVYLISRKNIIFEQWIKGAGWWPDYQPRLFKPGKVKWAVGVHRYPDLSGKVTKIAAQEKLAIEHHNYQSVAAFIARLNRYTDIQAKEKLETLQESNQKLTISNQELINRFSQELCKRLFALKGIDLGFHGVSLSFLQAMYEQVLYLKQWQSLGFWRIKNDQQSSLQALAKLKQDLSYWIADWQVKHSSGLAKFYWKIRRKLKK